MEKSRDPGHNRVVEKTDPLLCMQGETGGPGWVADAWQSPAWVMRTWVGGSGWKGRWGRQARRIEGAGRDSWNQVPGNLWSASSGR